MGDYVKDRHGHRLYSITTWDDQGRSVDVMWVRRAEWLRHLGKKDERRP